MRIVSGFLGGRKIKSVPGKNTRPTLDKVKESVFNALGQYFEKGSGLDLYAGSGNLGIEAISRGLDSCIFVDSDYKAYHVIKENVEQLKILEQTKVYKLSDMKALQLFIKNEEKFTHVFLDPPYKKQKLNDIMMLLEDENLLTDDAMIVCECLKEDQLLEEYKNIHLKKVYIYGMTKISIYERRGVLHA